MLDKPYSSTNEGEPLKLVVVGNGMVGHHLVSVLHNQYPDVQITVIGAEKRPAYDRVHLSEVFAGNTPEGLTLEGADDYDEWGVSVFRGNAVERIDRKAHQVVLADGVVIDYDKLVLATGSYPFVPPIDGNEDPRCFVYRTIDDLEEIRSCARGVNRGVVVGGGLLGLECANALRNLGLDTHVVEFAPGLMGVQLDETGSDVLKSKVSELDVKVHVATSTTQISSVGADELVMHFDGGETLTTDLIVFSAGIRPSDELARSCGLDVGERGGVVIDEHCCTSDPSIYAVGECALFDGRIFGLVAPGYRMAEVAASALNGGREVFSGADMSTKLKLLGVDVGSVGDAQGRADGTLSYVFSDPVKNQYKRLNLSADGKRVTGAVLVGDCEPYDQLLQYVLNELPVPEAPESLFLPASDASGDFDTNLLPDTATVCSCHNVSKGQLVECVQSGARTIGAIKTATKASTGCGGCAALVKSLFDHELTALGVEVDASMCSHFPYTRQQLFHLCKVEEIRTFDELLERYGTGLGCAVCKPAAASIFASLWNNHVHEPSLVGLQDTNDHFLANMQKNGTYSVVPRIPGGEITAERLIVIGEVAKDFDLYTKITGGQRIDLFGAQLHELPLIWKRLIDAGFETGHAYGKALRTVKSCVGSDWCRFGVQDSMAMALYLEDRYKGLRSPHKLKMAVSGCTRECAEARSKDVGVIATENGWNLYVCGNGGMRPRHADLFATDLDDETLIRYIDRMLMFYVRTADRLQRTSVWMENLEGGLDYLREVVIEDSLSLGAELEAQMANVVGTYQCEWRSTIEDADKMKRFRTFVNSDASDDGVVFVRERGQRKPAELLDTVEVVA